MVTNRDHSMERFRKLIGAMYHVADVVRTTSSYSGIGLKFADLLVHVANDLQSIYANLMSDTVDDEYIPDVTKREF